jgi:hypothetical protein
MAETTAERKHPHGTHLILFLVLLACELFLFGGHGMLYQFGKIGIGYAEIYSSALSGSMSGDFTNLLDGVIGLIVTMVVYYLIAGAVVIAFSFFTRRREKAPDHP